MKKETTTITINELDPEQAAGKNIARFMIRVLSKTANKVIAITDELEAGRHDAIGDLPKVVEEFTKVGVSTINAQNRFDKYLGDPGGSDRSIELDLDAARAEIRRRMDRLRASLGAGGLPE